ncbi:cell division protein FtsZ [Psychrobacter sp. YP14]|uniref:Cell division protein FtsZ n=3 Tax=Psychrobacter TaxID=497 RepID=A0A844LXZ0_9GAMM|nr:MULTISPECIES: cell division protein FtsZ [Psychrobacter]AWT48554.1 cell division protein FtsZ [Psychrobacter sp. YP14]MUG31290.1 cell division protein FtsZ [Psychrobacter sanguinis]
MSKYTMATNSHDLNNGQARFTVFGVGGGGGNAVEHMVQQGVKGVTFVCANTDKQALDRLTADNKLQLGANTNRGLGAGANPEVGREAAEQEEESIRKLLEDSDMVFITAGMGGGTGTGAAPVVARIAKEMEILTVGVVTTPFKFEGGKRIKAAKAGIDQLSNFVDSIITIPNDKLLKVYGNISMQDAFKKADDVLMHAVQGIAQTISSEGVINIDFNDIRTAMTAKGHAMMGIGRASGEDRARQATEKAIRSPLLDNLLLENAKGLIVNVVSSESVTLDELNQITEVVNDITDIEDANIFIGTVIDEKLGEDLHVTVIATGLTLDESQDERKPMLSANSNQTVDPSVHTSAFNSHQKAAQSQAYPAQAPAGSSSAPQQPAATKTNSIQDYLKRQQNR